MFVLVIFAYVYVVLQITFKKFMSPRVWLLSNILYYIIKEDYPKLKKIKKKKKIIYYISNNI